MKVLVCGDRNWSDSYAVSRELDALKTAYPDLVIIEGCARGADSMAEDWAAYHGVETHHHPADWEKFGKAAGPIRNREMLTEKPDFVIAFHSNLPMSKGTKHMVNIARRAGIPTEVYET